MATLLAILNSQLESLNSGPVPIDVVQDLDERVLRQILGELAIANHAEDQREDRPLVPPDQLAERRVAPLLGQRDDVGVRKIEEVECWRRRHRLDGPRRIEMRRAGSSQSTWALFGKPAALP